MIHLPLYPLKSWIWLCSATALSINPVRFDFEERILPTTNIASIHVLEHTYKPLPYYNKPTSILPFSLKISHEHQKPSYQHYHKNSITQQTFPKFYNNILPEVSALKLKTSDIFSDYHSALNGSVLISPLFARHGALKGYIEKTLQTKGFQKMTQVLIQNPRFKKTKLRIEIKDLQRGLACTTIDNDGIIITFDENAVQKASEAEIIAALLHEMAHATLEAKLIEYLIIHQHLIEHFKCIDHKIILPNYYTKYPPENFGNDTDYPEHNFIADYFLNDMVEAMKEYATGKNGKHINNLEYKASITNAHYKALILYFLRGGFNQKENMPYIMPLEAWDKLPTLTQKMYEIYVHQLIRLF